MQTNCSNGIQFLSVYRLRIKHPLTHAIFKMIQNSEAEW
uniref:Uncharacterized protein n=1 Tax=Anguilla anguilla TaxID=7936 RepID=A0A0E9SKP8_ANGAN